MTDFAAERRIMVDCQVRTADVTDQRLIAAMLALPRERFLPERNAALAYLDLDLPAGDVSGRAARCMLKPMVLAKLTQMAEIVATDRVLDVGCATGYSSALAAHLAGSVVALEDDPALAGRAGEALLALGLTNAQVVCGPLVEGWPQAAPYDVILIEGAVELVPESLLKQLRDGGRLVCILGRDPARKATLYRSVNGEFSGRPMFDAAAPLLPGFSQPPVFAF